MGRWPLFTNARTAGQFAAASLFVDRGRLSYASWCACCYSAPLRWRTYRLGECTASLHLQYAYGRCMAYITVGLKVMYVVSLLWP